MNWTQMCTTLSEKTKCESEKPENWENWALLLSMFFEKIETRMLDFKCVSKDYKIVIKVHRLL